VGFSKRNQHDDDDDDDDEIMDGKWCGIACIDRASKTKKQAIQKVMSLSEVQIKGMNLTIM
jgi:hypothetical protein